MMMESMLKSRYALLVLAGIACGLQPTRSVAQENSVYSYDALGRLVATSASGGPNSAQTSYELDPAGNRTRVTVTVSGSTPAPNTSQPIANPDSITVTTVAVCDGVAVDVLANDTDPNGSYPLQLISATGDNGIEWYGRFVGYRTYPTAEPGTVSATYVVKNSAGAQSSGQVTFTITGSERPCD